MKNNLKTIIAVWYTQVGVNIIGLPIYYKTTFRDTSKIFFNKTRLGSRFFAILIIPLFLIGCATVKKSNTETEIKTDSEKNTTIDISKFSNSFTLEPMDLEKPILLGKDTIYNTRVIYNNTKEIVKEKSDEKKTVDLKQDKTEKEKDYTKVIESVTTKLFWLLIIMFVITMVANYLKRKASII